MFEWRLFVSQLATLLGYEQIVMKFYGGVQCGKRNSD